MSFTKKVKHIPNVYAVAYTKHLNEDVDYAYLVNTVSTKSKIISNTLFRLSSNEEFRLKLSDLIHKYEDHIKSCYGINDYAPWSLKSRTRDYFVISIPIKNKNPLVLTQKYFGFDTEESDSSVEYENFYKELVELIETTAEQEKTIKLN